MGRRASSGFGFLGFSLFCFLVPPPVTLTNRFTFRYPHFFAHLSCNSTRDPECFTSNIFCASHWLQTLDRVSSGCRSVGKLLEVVNCVRWSIILLLQLHIFLCKFSTRNVMRWRSAFMSELTSTMPMCAVLFTSSRNHDGYLVTMPKTGQKYERMGKEKR